MNWLLFISILLIILFIPIPLKFTFSYKEQIFNFKIYNKTVFSNRPSFKKANKKKKSKKEKTTTSKPARLSYSLLIEHLQRNIFKPWIKFNYNMEYCFNDSAFTAISYGLLYNMDPIVYLLLQNFFSVKAYTVNIVPNFKNIFEVEVDTKAIIFFNIFQVLTIFYYTKKSYIKNNKEVSS